MSDDIVQMLVYDLDAKYSLEKVLRTNKSFKNFKYARYATDFF